jgi:predicted aspartyl protease
MRHATVLLLALLSVAGCVAEPIWQTTTGSSCRPFRLADVPIEMHRDMLFVRATVSGSPIILLLDTGAERTLFTEEAVKRLRLPRDLQHATRTLGIGSSAATWDAKLPDGLVLGGTRFPMDSITVGHFAIMQTAGGPADGMLGADVLLAFDLDLDLPARRLTFYRARSDCRQATPPWAEPYIGVAGITTQRDRLLVPFELDGVHGVGILDTGAQISSVSQNMMMRLGLEEGEMETDRIVVAHGAAPEPVTVRLHRFHELRVGPAVMHWPVLPVVPMSPGMGDALVGADFLQGRRVWISFASHRLFITPLEQGPLIARMLPVE